jgi:mannose-6-phosphate isomerase-like protein (cupin superfamily)
MNVTNLRQQAARLTEYWSPKVVGQVNDQYVKVAKIKGEMAWHQHDHEDELFLVLRGNLTLELEDGAVHLGEGDCYIMPKGVLHHPVAAEECLLALVETVTTLHTGNVVTEQTKSIKEQLAP